MTVYTSAEKNYAVCRKELDLIPNGNFLSNGYEECRNMSFCRIAGCTRFWEHEPDLDASQLTGDILNSCVRHGVPFAYVISGSKDGIQIYIGTLKVLLDSLKSSYEASYPGVDMEYVPDNPLRTCAAAYGGIFTGIPTDKISAEKKGFQIENICRGMAGRDFTYVILASGISSIAVTFGHERLLEEMETVYGLINRTVSGGAQGNLQAQHQDFYSKDYFENLEILEKSLKQGAARGMWRVSGYYAAGNQLDARKLGNIIKASFSGADSRPEPFRVIEYNRIREVIVNTYMMADLSDRLDLHPLGRWRREGVSQEISLYIYKFQTLLSSDQLAALCQLPTKEFPGFYIDDYVEFDVSNRTRGTLREPLVIGDICTAGRKQSQDANNQYLMEKDDLTRHALIIGITGGGKTNTSKSLLNTLWNTPDPKDRVPFLVIESAKREYWELRNLKGFEDILVFTLGAEDPRTAVRYRINPFETNPGISLQTHIDYLLSTFKAAFDLFPPLPHILEKCVYEIYTDRGWDIVENRNRYGLTEYPTLSDLYNKVDVIVDSMGYHQEVESNMKAALQARIYSLMIGGKGAMLNTPRSVPIGELLSRPVVMELEDLGDDETKSFVIGILLVQLYEYRKSLMTKGAKKLSHVLMVEEAHRLLKNVPEGGEGGNTRAKSVEFFCNLLAEIRTFGQGIMIADQIPTKIAPDSIKNTNLKIVHRTVALEDRETMGRAMNMNDDQIGYLSSLRRGYAAVYSEGDSKPKCVKFPLVTSYYEKSRGEVILEARQKVQRIADGYDQVVSNHAGCAYCENRCRHYAAVKAFVDTGLAVDQVLAKWAAHQYRPAELMAFLNAGPVRALHQGNDCARRCILGCILERQPQLNAGQRQKYIADYLKELHKSEGEKHV
ncbi:ATP-binding protein [Dysosmobacter sp.]|uniref:ATP-binding protein n=1 Tax=Dysosmobacter sp. TaxID=2591382 RepID=UPI002A88F2F5|nr:DUF87 domain-containing protein [Dysosmobacter sp.]MDY3281374.1 DUF87 domain-containing protein [Dysosmobacter sp.]